MPEPFGLNLKSRLNDRPGRNSCVLWDHHDAFPYLIESMIHFTVWGERFYDNVVANAGVFLNDRALNFTISSNANRRPISLIAIPVSTHHDGVLYFRTASDHTAQPDQ